MRVFVAGATGVVGRPLVRDLVAAGHEVTGMTRRQTHAPELEAAGAAAVVADALDAESVGAAVSLAMPDVVINQLTDLTSMGSNLRRMDNYFEGTNRLRTEGNDNLLSAAIAAERGASSRRASPVGPPRARAARSRRRRTGSILSRRRASGPPTRPSAAWSRPRSVRLA